MALDARRRQRKAEKRKAKERAKRKELARHKSEGLGQRLANVAAAPVLHCCTTDDLWGQGMAQVLISRELTNGQVAFSVFLIDRYCLGVKDAFCEIAPKSDYFDRLYDRFTKQGGVVQLQPAAARKLVEGAVDYARSLGLAPHADYARAKHIFGDIDPAASNRRFEFGCDGKPHFIAGPHDSQGRIASIMGILTERLGPEGFHFTVPISPSQFDDEDTYLAASNADDDYDDEEYGPDGMGDEDDEYDAEDDFVAPMNAHKPSTKSRIGGILHLLFGK